MSLTRVVLLRHGRTAWNHDGRIQGHSDPGLDGTGRDQVAAAAPRVAGYAPTVLVSSDLQRAWDSAAEVAKATDLTPRPEPRLRETAMGQWEGRTHAEIDAETPGAIETWRREATFVPPGGESRRDVARRARAVLDELAVELVTDRPAAPDEPATAVLVAHGGVINSLVGSFLGWPSEVWTTLRPLDNAHWAVLERTHGRWRLAVWGDGA